MRSVEPDIKPGETAIEYLKRTEAKRVHDMIMAGEAPRDGQYIEPIPGPTPAAPAAPTDSARNGTSTPITVSKAMLRMRW